MINCSDEEGLRIRLAAFNIRLCLMLQRLAYNSVCVLIEYLIAQLNPENFINPFFSIP